MNDLLLPENMLPLLVVIGVWDLVWKTFAMWKAAKGGHKVWFVVLMVINSVGILPMLYLLLSKKKEQPEQLQTN